MSRIIGIDLGTTNCCGAYFDPFLKDKKKATTIFEDEQGDPLLPSNLAVKEGQVFVGREAKNLPHSVAFVKREIEKQRAVYQLTHVKNPTPVGISAEYLKAIKQRAEKDLGESISRAVVTVPAHFNHHQKTATREAGELANLKVEDLLAEPSAAALAYSWQYDIDDATILVYDLGGGTFDATILTIKDKICKIAGHGNGLVGESRLGGYDFDRRLAEEFVKYLLEKKEVKLTDEQRFAILSTAEKVKIAICKEDGNAGGTFKAVEILGEEFKDVEPLTISLSRFRALIDIEINHTIRECWKTFEECKKSKPDLKLDKIIMVGGSSRIPFIREKLKSEFGVEPYLFNPDLCIAIGAAIYASRFGHTFESAQARIILRPFPFKIDEHIHIDGVVKILDDEGKEIESVAQYKINLRDAEGNYNKTVLLDEQSRFMFKKVPVPALDSCQFFIELESSEGEHPVMGTFSLSRGERIKPEQPRISQPFKIKTINGMIDLLPAGAPLGSSASKTFYTTSDSQEIRIPAYEGLYPLGDLVVNLEKTVDAGIPIEVNVGYNQKNQIVLSAESEEHGIEKQDVPLELKRETVERLSQDQYEKFKENYTVVLKEIYDQLELLPHENKEKVKQDVEYQTAIIDRELISRYSDANRIMDSFMRLEFIRTMLSIPQPNIRNVEMMTAVLRESLVNVQVRKDADRHTEVINKIKQDIVTFERMAKEACENNDIKKYAEAQNEFQVTFSKLQELQPDVDLSPKFYERIVDEAEKKIKDSIRSFEQVLKEPLPKLTEFDAWKSINRQIENETLQGLFEELKQAILALCTIQAREAVEQSKGDDLRILVVNKVIPLHKKIVHYLSQKGLLKV